MRRPGGPSEVILRRLSAGGGRERFLQVKRRREKRGTCTGQYEARASSMGVRAHTWRSSRSVRTSGIGTRRSSGARSSSSASATVTPSAGSAGMDALTLRWASRAFQSKADTSQPVNQGDSSHSNSSTHQLMLLEDGPPVGRAARAAGGSNGVRVSAAAHRRRREVRADANDTHRLVWPEAKPVREPRPKVLLIGLVGR